MSDRRIKTYLGIIALVLVCMLAGTLSGAVAGGVAGYYLGHRAARAEVQHLASPSPTPTPGGRTERAEPQEQPWPNLSPWPKDWDFEWPGEGSLSRVTVVARVEKVVAGSPAEQAGLRVGDRITAVDGLALSLTRNLAQAIGQYKPGDSVTLTVERAGQEEKIKVTLGENPDKPGRPYLGLNYRLVVTARPGRSNS